MAKKTVVLNGKQISLKEFEEKKKLIFSTRGLQLVEVKPGEYKTRLLG